MNNGDDWYLKFFHVIIIISSLMPKNDQLLLRLRVTGHLFLLLMIKIFLNFSII